MALLASAAGHTYHFLGAERGFAYYAARALNGARLVDGVLHPAEESPSVPPTAFVRAALSKLMPGMPGFVENVPDSFVVVDTGAGTIERQSTFVVLGDTALRFTSPLLESQSVPYERLFGPNATVEIDRKLLRRVLERHVLGIGMLYVQWDLMVLLYKTLAGLPLLFIAAYILNFGDAMAPAVALKKAAFTFPVVLIGTALEAVAGATMVEPWYLFMAIALFVVLRSNWRSARERRQAEKQ